MVSPTGALGIVALSGTASEAPNWPVVRSSGWGATLVWQPRLAWRGGDLKERGQSDRESSDGEAGGGRGEWSGLWAVSPPRARTLPCAVAGAQGGALMDGTRWVPGSK